jgi:hypothetical protein
VDIQYRVLLVSCTVLHSLVSRICLRSVQDKLTIEIDDFVIQPCARSQAAEIGICDLQPCYFSNDATLLE